MHPRLIPDEKIIGIPEPQVHVHEGPLYLRAEEVIHAELPALTYLVRLCIVEFHDWTTSSACRMTMAGVVTMMMMTAVIVTEQNSPSVP